jgi:hypothetical protein
LDFGHYRQADSQEWRSQVLEDTVFYLQVANIGLLNLYLASNPIWLALFTFRLRFGFVGAMVFRDYG